MNPMADPATYDLQTFFIAFAVVWGGIALYLVHLHRAEVRLRERLERLKGP